jgi:hypothetical protein
MSQLIVTAPTRAPAFRDRSDIDQADHRPEPRPSRLWTLIQALAYAGALIDPTGILAFERFRQAQEEAKRTERR